MYLDERKKKIVRKAIEDYEFIKEELENKIKQNYNLEELSEFLLKFKGTCIENLDTDSDIECYLDFEYNDVNMCCIWDTDKGLRVSNLYEIYDKEKEEFLSEDWLTTDDYKKWLNKTREEELENLVVQLKYCECKGLVDYSSYEREIINFLKMNW